MSETLYNVTIPNTSPTINYTPPVTNSSSGGWQSICPTSVTSPSGENYWICDPDSAHTTTSNNTAFQFSFNGVAIYLFGNTTSNVQYEIDIDSAHFEAQPTPSLGLLYSATGLTPGMHTVGLTVRQPGLGSDPGRLTFDEAVVSAGTGLTGGEFERDVLDDGDPSITYYTPPGGNWTIENTYAQSIGPNGSTTFRNSYWTDATAKYSAYSASIDGGAETSYGRTSNPSSNDGAVQQRISNCLRYSQTGLGGINDHTLVLRVNEGGRLAVDWINVFSVRTDQGGDGGMAGEAPNPPSLLSDPKIPTIVGAISGGVALILVLLTIFVCLRRRKYDGSQHILTLSTQVMPQIGLLFEPLQVPPAPRTPTPITPPWAQLLPPASSPAANNSRFIGSGMPGVAMSIGSSHPPTYSSIGPPTYHSNSHRGALAPSTSNSFRPGGLARSTTAVSRSSWAPGSSIITAEAGPSAGPIAGGGYFGDGRGTMSAAPPA